MDAVAVCTRYRLWDWLCSDDQWLCTSVPSPYAVIIRKAIY